MKKVGRIETTSEYNSIMGIENVHPLISVIDFAKVERQNERTVDALQFGFYAIFFKNDTNCILKYGRNNYDYQEGSLVFIAPNQIISIENDGENYEPNGHALLFHPDIMQRTALASKIKEYSFFSYSVHEALHLSESEKRIILDIFTKIHNEISRPIDKHSKQVIISNIELLLNYCLRFYDRQFITRDNLHVGIIEKTDAVLNTYFETDTAQILGTPSVSYIADKVHLSANYLGDLIKKEIGVSAQEYIHSKIITIAQERIFDRNKSLSQISFELGFKYPHHFTRLFKQKIGVTPKEFRSAKNAQ